MRLRIRAKLTTIIIGAVAVATIAGAGVVLASQSHSAALSASHEDAPRQEGSQFEAQGVIQQVTFDQGSTRSGSLVFLPDKQQATVTVVFNTSTKIEVEGDNANTSQGERNDGAHQDTLQAGMSAEVEGTLQADGSVLARGIQAHVKGSTQGDGDGNDDRDGDHHGDDGSGGSGQNGQPTSTPGSGGNGDNHNGNDG